MRSSEVLRSRKVVLIGLAVLQFTIGVGAAAATTLIMPNRDALKGTAVVVWGNTTQANGTAQTLDCGDGSAPTVGTVVDQSYIAFSCTYANAGPVSAKITVGAEVATATVTVRDPAALSAFDLRATKVNMAIEDGLRFLYFSQFNRAATFTANIGNPKPMTSWRSATGTDNYTNRSVALAVLAIQNHGHQINSPATDIFQPVVLSGLNWLFDNAVQKNISPCGVAPDPCVNVPAPISTGLAAPAGDDGYATPIFASAIGAATAAAPNTLVAAGIGTGNALFVAGKTYAEVLQRFVNAVAWGQSDGPNFGWIYNLNSGNSADGSTQGWAMLGLEIGQAAGAVIPAFVKAGVASTLPRQLNNNGSLDYQADNNPASTSSNPAKTGIALQSLSFVGAAVGDPRVTAATAYLVRNWNATVDPQDFTCGTGTPTDTNKGCGYAMFNVFKGLRLYGIPTLPGIGRPAGPGPIPADDWYADYVDNLVANQHSPTNPSNGEWTYTSAPFMDWSCCDSDTTGITAMAELILAPTAFVAPTTVTLAPAAAANPVGTTHTVTATALTAAGGPAPGVTVTFTIVSGPNAGPATCAETGTSTNTTDANGQAKCTYTDTKGAGTDTIQASIGAIVSNVVSKVWGGAIVLATIPTLSEWGLVALAVLLALASLWALRRRTDRTG